MPADPKRVRDLFLAVAERPPGERPAFLAGAGGPDADLRAGVERLLAAHDDPASVLPSSRATADRPPTANGAVIDEWLGTVVGGKYKLLQQIGEGGMGVVYMAEQTEPVRRKVALKIIKPGMDSRQVIARFEAERQALAMMDHQNIARVFDAGMTSGEPGRVSAGCPYFVMELVHGVPITQYCDDNRLNPRQRLALFVPVCQAIQHAHQKGIIHRDVKPSNVLVTMYDDKPVPKVIDFGVAKAVEQRITDKSMFTQFGALVGTFEYMSPEQAEMNAFGVDTRSDIYSLGVLLYELLKGTTPLERKRVREAALDELVRLIKEEEAPRPSVRLSSSSFLPKIAAERRTEPARLSKLVRGEIDWIVMKCLEKDRSRRYDTASGLARDVERYLADEPVEACPPSASYRLRKFARKYKKALATAAAFAGLLVAGVVLSTALAVWATSAERESNRQRIASEAAKQEAVDARGTADKQRDQARLTAYATGMGLAMNAWDENNVARARELLATMPTEAAGRDLRGFEWHYLSRVCRDDVPTLRGHESNVMGVAFSPDGRLLASVGVDNTVKLWDCASGREVKSLRVPTENNNGVAFSPDGRLLATGSADKKVVLWDPASGEELKPLLGHADNVTAVAFSPDGRRLASASRDTTIKVWDSATGQELVALKGHAAWATSVAFHPDGRRLASGSSDGAVIIWDSATGQEVIPLKGHPNTVRSVAFSPDGRLLASASADKTVKTWDCATGLEVASLQDHTHVVACVAFSPDGRRLASGSLDTTVKIWDMPTRKVLVSLKGHAGNVRGVAFSPDGRHLASASNDNTVKIWDSATAPEPLALPGHAVWATSVAFSPDGRRLASASRDKSVQVWDSATGRKLATFTGHTNWVMSVAFSLDGRRVASASSDKTVQVWDSATGQRLVDPQNHAGSVQSVRFSPDGRRLASASNDNMVTIWDSATGQVFFHESHAGYVFATGVAFSPDGRRLAWGSSDKTVTIRDSATGQELVALKGHADPVLGVAFSPDGRLLASASADNTVKLWDWAAGRELASLKGHAGVVHGVAFSPDGRRLASASNDNTVKLWDCATGLELASLKGRAGGVNSVAFSPDGQCLASAHQDGSIKLWETNIPPDVRERRAAEQIVADLFRQFGRRAEVLDWLRTAPGLSPSERQAALAAAETYPEK